MSIETAEENNAQQLEIAETNPLRYRGYYYDNETGYYYLQSRYYDPELGRFISADDFSYINPRNPLNVNAYAYCANNPLIYSDPKGTAYVSDVGIAVAEIFSALLLCWDAFEFGGEDFAYWIAGGILLDHENIFKMPRFWYFDQRLSFDNLKNSQYYKDIKAIDPNIFNEFYNNVLETAKDTFEKTVDGIKITIRYIAIPMKKVFDDMLNDFCEEALKKVFFELNSKLKVTLLSCGWNTIEMELYKNAITIRDKFERNKLFISYEFTEYYLNSKYISQTSAIYLEIFIEFMIAVCATAGVVFKGWGGLTI